MGRLSPANEWLKGLLDPEKIKRRLKRAKPVISISEEIGGYPESQNSQAQLSQKDSDLNADQRIATAGEVVPIIFGKRSGDNGGVWISPPLAKAGSYFFTGSFLFPVSQGEIVSSPEKHRTWVGLRNMAFLDDQTITISNIYNSAASLAASPGTCPVLGAGMYCGIGTYSYLTETLTPSGTFTSREDWAGTSYYGIRNIARGTGDTTNSVIKATVEVFDNVTGADLTTAWFAYLGIPATTEFLFNVKLDSSGVIIGGYAVDVVQDLIDGTNVPPGSAQGYVAPPDPVLVGIGSSGSVTYVYTGTGVNNQINPSNPPSTGTLEGFQSEYVISTYADPDSTPLADNSSYADITFLKVVGDIYDPPESGSYPTTTRQVHLYYEQGVKVDLYTVDPEGSTQGASNYFMDLAMYLLTIYKLQDQAATPDISRPILTGNMQDLATFCDNYTLHFNGAIAEPTNIVQYLSQTAPFFLLAFVHTGGRYRFVPVLPLNGSQQINTGTLTPRATFTEDEILPGSYSKTYASASDKSDLSITALYRSSTPDQIGTTQTVQVRYTGTSIDAPVEQFDLSGFCSSRDHAVICAKHVLARRRYSTHSVQFDVPLDTVGLIPYDVIKIQKQRISSVGDNRTESEFYQIMTVDHNADGTTSIEAAQFPVNGSGAPTISTEVLSGSFTVV